MSIHPDPVLWAIETSKYQPSILKIKEFMTDKGMSFSLSYTTQEKTYKVQHSDKVTALNISLLLMVEKLKKLWTTVV